MDQQLQVSTSTHQGRNVNMFNRIKSHIPPDGRIKVLSFGCSKGDEIEDLSNVFNNSRQLVGVEYNDVKVQYAADRFQHDPKISIYQSSDFDPLKFKSHFDLVVCCNVLCNFVSMNQEDRLPLSRFTLSIETLWSMVARGGLLYVCGANYLAQDVLNVEEFDLILLHSNSGPVPCYRSVDGELHLLSRQEAKIHVLQKKFLETN